MAIIRKLKGVRLLDPNSGLMFCNICEKIVGNINVKGYNYINISFGCTCGNQGSVEINRTRRDVCISDLVYKMPRSNKGRMMCKNCGALMFGMISDRIEGYSFYVECKCGEKYDTVPTFEMRLGETLEMYKKLKK